MPVEDVLRIERRDGAVPDRRGDDPGVDLDAFRVRLGDEGVERIERQSYDVRLRPRHHRAIAEAVAAATDLHNEGVEVRGFRLRDELCDLRVAKDAFAER